MIRRSVRVQEITHDPTVRALRTLSILLGFMALAYGAVYLGPDYLIRSPQNAEFYEQQISIVRHVEAIGPIWPFAFIFAGVMILVTVYLGRGLILAHGFALGVWTTYGLAIFLGGLLSEPPSPVLVGVAAIFIGAIHAVMTRAWAGEGVR
ncbi:membrane protein [Rhodococcus phage MacGully]|nr:membrane protein [Rhodococcus phage MacGully]